ncbi:glycosyltransferase involved in cell wall biosynthesis [Aliiruegeria haliotis]|uniref:Glycosyltransferase involved in cell wall biosynthesis n=1 Tax=Aliiruegeria haliotis TaxID=1280846 RepID=A0A2T0RVI6_9RHOB|nr:glycosyltransferase [Aliiruegeria haliotis]PRY25160.1 glycosyltransferase involved in cell wall biosynthesis [Aliiruegeria haliotis]
MPPDSGLPGTTPPVPAVWSLGARPPRVALIHYWLVGMRGGEKVLESLCRMFPQAEIFTHVVVPEKLSPTLRRHRIHTSFVANLPMAPKLYQKYLPFMPRALEQLDLSGFDLVISSESGPAKGVIAPPEAPHLCYCHSPMRYLWDQYHTYRDGAGRLTRMLMPHMAHRLRQWDVTSAARVDGFVANSTHVAARINKYWRREAEIVYPPVAVEEFAPVASHELGDFYLWAGELAPYKRPDMAVEAFNRLGRKLVVIGGPVSSVNALQGKAKDNITFLGHVPFDVLRGHMARAKALIFPGEEDFGIVPVEVMASGRPVIAYGRGGALDTVIDGKTGLLFGEQSADALVAAVERFEAEGMDHVDPAGLSAHAARFSEPAFSSGITQALGGLGIPANAIHA